MNTEGLSGTTRAPVAVGNGLLAMDESTPISKRGFVNFGSPQIQEGGRANFEWIVTASGPGEFTGGAILHDDSVRNARCKAPSSALAPSIAPANQQPGLVIWLGKDSHSPAVQQVLLHRAGFNRGVGRGEYSLAMGGAGCAQTK